MTTMAQVSGGQFYDADAPERFPATAPPMIIKPIQSISARMRTSISGGKAGRQEPDAFAALQEFKARTASLPFSWYSTMCAPKWSFSTADLHFPNETRWRASPLAMRHDEFFALDHGLQGHPLELDRVVTA